MNNKKIIEALNVTINGLMMLRDEFEGADSTPVKEETVAPVVEEKNESAVAGEYSVEDLKKMKYNDFKKYASQLGVDCKGTRDEIMSRVVAVLGNAPEETEAPVEEEVVEDTPAVEEEAPKSNKLSGGKKLAKKQVEEPARDEFDEQAEEIAKDTDVEDIISALADVNVKATKKNAVSQLAKALREGLIELDDDEEEEAVEETSEAEESGEELTATTYTPEYDPNGYNDPEKMTEERAQAVEELMQSVVDSINSGELDVDTVIAYLEANATEEESELLGEEYTDEDLVKFYMELLKRTVDDEGEVHEPSDPYVIGESDMCCGHELKYSKKTEKYICEVCGTEYEAE